MAPHSSTPAWKIPWTEEPGRLHSMGSLGVGHDQAPSLSLFTFMHWRRKWQPTPAFLLGESQGRGSLVGCRLWGHTESDTTEVTQQQQQQRLQSHFTSPFRQPQALSRPLRSRVRVFDVDNCVVHPSKDGHAKLRHIQANQPNRIKETPHLPFQTIRFSEHECPSAISQLTPFFFF